MGEWWNSSTILNLGTILWWVVSWVGTRARLDDVENTQIPAVNRTSAVQFVARRCTDWTTIAYIRYVYEKEKIVPLIYEGDMLTDAFLQNPFKSSRLIFLSVIFLVGPRHSAYNAYAIIRPWG
jgi:hypothetical protein